MILICILYLGFIFSPITLSYVAIVPKFNGVVKSIQSNEVPQICLTRLAASMCISIPSHFGSFVPNPPCASPTRFQGMGMASLSLMNNCNLKTNSELIFVSNITNYIRGENLSLFLICLKFLMLFNSSPLSRSAPQIAWADQKSNQLASISELWKGRLEMRQNTFINQRDIKYLQQVDGTTLQKLPCIWWVKRKYCQFQIFVKNLNN